MKASQGFQAILDRQPYDVTLEGIRLTVCKDVFPPDFGYTARNLDRMLAHYQHSAALDLGCGTGDLALAMRRRGVVSVWAAEIDLRATACCRLNLDRNPHPAPVTVVQSDLFENVNPASPFDLILFRQPHFPGVGDEHIPSYTNGGAPLIRRFLSQARDYPSPGGVMLMAFQDTAGEVNDPKNVAADMPVRVRTIFQEREMEINHYIYELKYA
jgi:methylase of polypeptide subunit release factors